MLSSCDGTAITTTPPYSPKMCHNLNIFLENSFRVRCLSTSATVADGCKAQAIEKGENISFIL